MPTYQYTCTECATPMEAVQSFSDRALEVCPTCGGKLRKVFSAVGVVFKGSGFYRNDSRSNGKAASADSGKAASAEAGASGKGTDASNGTSPGTSTGSGSTSSDASPASERKGPDKRGPDQKGSDQKSGTASVNGTSGGGGAASRDAAGARRARDSAPKPAGSPSGSGGT